MKNLLTLFLLFTIGCGHEDRLNQTSSKVHSAHGNSLDVQIKVSNHYKEVLNEDSENDLVTFREVLTSPAQVKIPVEIVATKGVSGFRWLTLDLGNRQFCYQGNGFPGGKNSNGELFILRGVQKVGDDECYKRKYKTVHDDTIMLSSGDIISSKIHGKVCIHFCDLLEAKYSLTYLTD